MEGVSSVSSDSSGKGREAFRTISEVADFLDLPQHVLRFWESKFSQVKPLKRGGNRRYYRPDDITLLTAIKKLLHSDGYTIRGVQKLFKAQGLKATILLALDESGGVEHLASSTDMSNDPTSRESDPFGKEGSISEGIDRDALVSVLGKLRAIRSRLD